jgi:hypothetical protein
MFLGLLLVFSSLIYLASKTQNNILTVTISLTAIANVIGTPILVLNKASYSYAGWNAVKDFDFSIISFLKIYAYSFSAIVLLIAFIWLIERYTKNKPGKPEVVKHSTIVATSVRTVKGYKIVWSLLLFLLLFFSLVLAIFMYVNKIAVLGVEPERLPFKLVGILFYFRGYVLPILLFIVFRKSSQSFLLKVLVVITALIVGALSASRGVTFFYLFPVLTGILIQKISFARISLVAGLVLLGYFVTSMTRDLTYSTSGLSVLDLPLLLLSSRSEFQSNEGIVVTLLSLIGTISNRLYGAQDLVLAYQHILINPWQSFGNFLLTAPIMNDLAADLYGLKFLPGQGYGVGLGLVGLLVMIARADITLLIAAIFFFSVLAVILNRVLTRLFLDPKTGKFFQLYYLILFITAFNFLQATLPYLYVILFSTWVLGFFFNQKLTKRHEK